MITFDSSQQTQVAQPSYAVHWLIEADFTTGIQRVTTAAIDVQDSLGNNYLGLGQLVSVSDVTENSDVTASKVTVAVPIVNQSLLALTLGNVSTYRGRSIRLYLQLFDANHARVGPRVLRWAGYMNPVQIKPNKDGGGRIEIPCTKAGMNRFRNFAGLRLTHAQQVSRFPGDLGLQYMADLIEKPALWLSKRFQEI